MWTRPNDRQSSKAACQYLRHERGGLGASGDSVEEQRIDERPRALVERQQGLQPVEVGPPRVMGSASVSHTADCAAIGSSCGRVRQNASAASTSVSGPAAHGSCGSQKAEHASACQVLGPQCEAQPVPPALREWRPIRPVRWPPSMPRHGSRRDARREVERLLEAFDVGDVAADDVERACRSRTWSPAPAVRRAASRRGRSPSASSRSGPDRGTSRRPRRSRRVARRRIRCRAAAARARRSLHGASAAIAGAMTSISSRPIDPPSPACGLRPATAMRGAATPAATR